MPLIEIQDLIKIYKDYETKIEVPALRGIELSVAEGELIGIVGPSGAGKTTLLSIVGGLLSPSSGEVIINDMSISNLDEKQLTSFRQKTIGFIWQLPEDNLIANLSLIKNVMLPMQISNKPFESQKKNAKELLERVGLGSRVDHKPHQVSGGEAQRAALAVALANDPLLLLGDQITGELDSATSEIVIDYLRELNGEFGITMMIATHKKQFIQSTDHSFEIKDGRITKVLTSTGESWVQTSEANEGQGRTLPGPKEEFIFVDWQGNLRLPEEVLRAVKLEGLVRAEVEEGIIKLIPVQRKNSTLHLSQKKSSQRRKNNN